MSPAAPPDRVRTLLEPVVRATGLDLEDVTVTAAGRRRLVRIVVDADGGVSLDAVAMVSSAVSAALDGSDVLGEAPYVLEVTSPGVDRPLREARHWRRAAGRLVEVSASTAGQVTGRVLRASGDVVTLDVQGAEVDYPLADLGPGHVQVEFSRPGAPADGNAEADDPDSDDTGSDEPQEHDADEEAQAR